MFLTFMNHYSRVRQLQVAKIQQKITYELNKSFEPMGLCMQSYGLWRTYVWFYTTTSST